MLLLALKERAYLIPRKVDLDVLERAFEERQEAQQHGSRVAAHPLRIDALEHLQRALQLGRNGRDLDAADILRADDALGRTAARALQALERELHEVLDAARLVWSERGDTEARNDLERLAAVGHLRRLQLLVHAARQRLDMRGARPCRNDDEGGLGGASHRILYPKVGADELRDFCQQLIGHVLAGVLRDLGVAVDAKRHDRHDAAVAPGRRVVLASLDHQIVRRKRAGERIVRDGLLDDLLVLLQVVACLHQLEQVVDARQHLGRVGLLGDEVVGAHVARALLRRLVLVAGDDDDRQLLDARIAGGAHALEKPEAIELRHVEVGHHHDDRRIALDGLPACLAVGDFAHGEGGAEDAIEGSADELGVVDDQDPFFRDVAGGRHQAARSTTTRPRICEAMKRSNTEGSSAKGIVCAISFSRGGRRSPARRRQTSWRSSDEGLSVELMPSRDTPRRMNGMTVVLRLTLAASPIEAMTPFTFMVLAIQARTSPPRLSTAPAHSALSRGLIFVRSSSPRSLISAAPSFFSQSASAALPVSATTW